MKPAAIDPPMPKRQVSIQPIFCSPGKTKRAIAPTIKPTMMVPINPMVLVLQWFSGGLVHRHTQCQRTHQLIAYGSGGLGHLVDRQNRPAWPLAPQRDLAA